MRDLIHKILKESDFDWVDDILKNQEFVGYYDLKVGDVIEIEYGVSGLWRVKEIKSPVPINNWGTTPIKIVFELVQRMPDGSFAKKRNSFLEMPETEKSKEKIFKLVGVSKRTGHPDAE